MPVTYPTRASGYSRNAFFPPLCAAGGRNSTAFIRNIDALRYTGTRFILSVAVAHLDPPRICGARTGIGF